MTKGTLIALILGACIALLGCGPTAQEIEATTEAKIATAIAGIATPTPQPTATPVIIPSTPTPVTFPTPVPIPTPLPTPTPVFFPPTLFRPWGDEHVYLQRYSEPLHHVHHLRSYAEYGPYHGLYQAMIRNGGNQPVVKPHRPVCDWPERL